MQGLRVYLYLLIFITSITHFQTHVYRYTHTSTHVWLSHRINDENQAQEPGWEGWRGFLVRAKCLAHAHTHTHKKKQMTAHQDLKSKKIRVNRASSKASSLFVCLFFVVKPENPYFAFRLGLEVKLLEVYPLGPRSSSCGPTKCTPPPRTTLRVNWGQYSTRLRAGSHPWIYAGSIQTHPQLLNSKPRSPTSDPPDY